ncbi:hypothetical protein CDL12_16659 [Handroanthus impetiginosus]|uniref:Mechanosensitive ion channel MscS domain-containing protein n=1 Tax=Handroanthus impetiginosus TaxID=429701 RepID=A0A2G9GZN6_9LAMI|nr:hypothetical protein CDL12_16659 [Handroanthus impetiginosus]
MPSSSSTSSSPSPAKDADVKINGRDSPSRNIGTRSSDDTSTNRMWRDSSYDFSNDAVMRATSNSKDFDFVSDSPISQKSPLSRIQESPSTNYYGQMTPRDVRVSFHENTEPAANRRSNAEQDEVLVCSSNNSFRRKPTLMRAKTKSRLLDPPEDNIQKSQTQRMGKSQVLGKGGSEIEEDDPFLEEDLPEDYKKMKFSALSIIQLLCLILIIAALVCSLTINVLRKRTVFELELWKWELMILVLISGSLLSGWGIRIAVFLIERNFLLRKRVLYFVYGLRKAVQNCVWLALVLIAWQCIFDKRVNAFRERRALALSLNDTKTAVNKLHHVLNVLVGILIIVIWLLILKVATTQFFIFLSSQLLLVVFMFGNTCKTTFEAIIFLFVMHPFDAGDRVEVDGVQMVVEEMNILTTVFLKFDNHKIYYPNSVLSTKPINNYYRSPDMGDAIDFCIHISTPMEKIALMRERITRYVDNRADHWYPAPMIVMRDVEDMNRLKFSVWLSHKMNHQDRGDGQNVQGS